MRATQNREQGLRSAARTFYCEHTNYLMEQCNSAADAVPKHCAQSPQKIMGMEFSSINATDPGRATAEGVKMLFHFIEMVDRHEAHGNIRTLTCMRQWGG